MAELGSRLPETRHYPTEKHRVQAHYSRTKDLAHILSFSFFKNPIWWVLLQVEESLFKIGFVCGIARNRERHGGERERAVREEGAFCHCHRDLAPCVNERLD